jgi:predicted MFS family arabinose efflux permease
MPSLGDACALSNVEAVMYLGNALGEASGSNLLKLYQVARVSFMGGLRLQIYSNFNSGPSF